MEHQDLFIPRVFSSHQFSKLLNYVVAIVKLISPTAYTLSKYCHNPGTSYMVMMSG
jgi:hypothetical protein